MISWKRLREFAARHPDAAQALAVWYDVVTHSTYETPAQVKDQFRSASFIGGTRTVFNNIAGNKYRLVVDIKYGRRQIYIRHVLTHREYDELAAQGNL